MNACSSAVLSPSELLLTSSPSHHSLACWYRAPLGNLPTLTDSVIDKVILEFVSNCARGVPLETRAKNRRSSSFYCTVGRAQNNLRKEDSGSGKAGSGHFLPQRERRPILLAAHRATFLLFCSSRRMSGNRNFPAG